MGDLTSYLALKSIAQNKLSQTDVSIVTLYRALAIGEPEGYMRTFVDLGSPMRDLLRIASRQDEVSYKAYMSRLLIAFPNDDLDIPPKTKQEKPKVEGLVEQLTDREMQILDLLAARRSYREIGEALYLSLNTVKWYIQSIYSKLGVSKRNQAVNRVQELGILKQ